MLSQVCGSNYYERESAQNTHGRFSSDVTLKGL